MYRLVQYTDFHSLVSCLIHSTNTSNKVGALAYAALIAARQHHHVVNDVLRILAVNDLYLKPQKCQFEQTEVEYLGVIISEDSIAMDPIKV